MNCLTSQKVNYEHPQTKFRGKVMFCNMYVLSNKMFDDAEFLMTMHVCCWQNVCATLPPTHPPFCKRWPFMHVSRWVLVESLLLPLIPGSHPHEWKGFLFFHKFICKYHMAFKMSTIAFHDVIQWQILSTCLFSNLRWNCSSMAIITDFPVRSWS